MGTTFGAVAFVSTLGMALGPWAGGWLYDAFGSYFWLFIGSFGIGLGAVAIAGTFRPPPPLPAAPSTASLARRSYLTPAQAARSPGRGEGWARARSWSGHGRARSSR